MTKNLLKISLVVSAILTLVIFLIVIIYEKESSENIIINLSKRIVAEGTAPVARFLIKDKEVNGFYFGPEVNSDAGPDKRLIIGYAKESFKGEGIKIINTKSYKIYESAKHFQYENFTNSELRLLREKYHLDKLVSGADRELDKIILLMGWLRKIIPSGDPERLNYNFSALDILSRAQEGDTFSCSGYSIAFVQSALSLGFTARYVGLFKGHIVAEIWSNEFAKWIVMDVYNDLHYEKDGIPLNALELHEIWEKRDFSGLNVLSGIERKDFVENTKEGLLSYYHEFYVRMRNDWFSHKYPHWHPKANSIMNALEWQDRFTRNNILVAKETTNKDDLYFPLNITAINTAGYDDTLGKLNIVFDTFTPNFEYFLLDIDGKEFNHNKGFFLWGLLKGKNHLKVCSVNSMGIKGPTSYVELERL